jgi:hypothetical protein
MMRKPFWLIDGKLREAHFFLEKLRHAPDLDDARFYFSAFTSAARSITYSLQCCIKGLPDADLWWEEQRERLKKDVIAKYFHSVRNQMNHVGLNPLQTRTHSLTMPHPDFLLADDKAPELNVLKAADQYMKLLTDISAFAYSKFWKFLDLPLSLTLEDFHGKGLNFEELEEELGLPPGYFQGLPDITRIHFLTVYSQTYVPRLIRQFGRP